MLLQNPVTNEGVSLIFPPPNIFYFLKKGGEGGRKKEEKYRPFASCMHPYPGTKPVTLAHALTGKLTDNPFALQDNA